MWKVSESRRAAVAVTAGIVCLIGCILACVGAPVSWSPDGKSFVFVQIAEKGVPRSVVYRCDASTGKLAEVVHSNHYLSAPAWSPDGKSICYLEVGEQVEGPEAVDFLKQLCARKADAPLTTRPSELEGYPVFRIELRHMKPDGSQNHPLASWLSTGSTDDTSMLTHLCPYAPIWDRQCRNIFVQENLAEPGGILLVDVQSGKTRPILANCIAPSLSPDGQFLAAAMRHGTERTTVYIRPLSNGIVQTATFDGLAATLIPPVWLPDSSAILLFPGSRGKCQVIRVDARTGQRRLLAEWTVEPVGAVLSPDGQILAVAAQVKQGETYGFELLFCSLEDIKYPKRLYATVGQSLLAGLSWSPNGQQLAVRLQFPQATRSMHGIMIYCREGKLERAIGIPSLASQPATRGK